MFASHIRRSRVVLGGILAVAMFTLLAGDPGSRPAEELSRQQQIAELERQIHELNQRLDDLRKCEPIAPPTAEGIPDDWVKTLHWRCIGPASMGGRITAISVFEADPTTYWVGHRLGRAAQDRPTTASLSSISSTRKPPFPSATSAWPRRTTDIVWVGTGEDNPRNSVSYGDGVYKSTDGGKTWKNMGLKKTFQIGRIVIHPKNPDIVYVGALGRLYGPNEERGLFKTSDGGKTWEKILYVDDKTGVIDMRMHPTDPETLLVATWERQRDGFDSHRGEPALPDGYDAYDPIKKWGPGSGIYKTTDGGKTFQKLTKGLPTCQLGRIGLDYYRKDPNVVFAIIDCEKIGMGTAAKWIAQRQRLPGLQRRGRRSPGATR